MGIDSDQTGEWDDAADTAPNVELAQGPDIVGEAPNLENAPLMAALGPAGNRKLAQKSDIHLKGFGCQYAPTCTIEFTPTQNGVELEIDSMGRPELKANLTLDHKTWAGWLELLGRELIRPAMARTQHMPSPGYPGDVRLRWEFDGGTMSYKETAGPNDRPQRFSQTLVTLLHMNGVMVDPNLVTT